MKLLILITALMSGQTPCTGPNCPRPTVALAMVNQDTETVRSVWVSNENRYALGVIRNGYFVAAAQSTPPAPPAAPAMAPAETGALTGDVPNYGILTDELNSPKSFGYKTNDKSFNPSHLTRPPPQPTPFTIPAELAANPYGMVYLLAGGVVFAAAVIIIIAKGRR
jgi:hypothetical protein